MLGLGNTLVNNKFGNIFTGILNKISVPTAAAYSLRLLNKDYTGSAIRVRRSSDNAETDIGFTAGGDLDETALLNHTAYDIGRVWDGGVLVASGARVYGITQLSNGDVLTVGLDTSRVYRSTDNGVTWDGGVLVAGGAGLVDITQLSNGDVLTVGYNTNRVYRSTDNGVTWDGGVFISGAGLVDITQLSNGDVLAVGIDTSRVYRSTDNGVTWDGGVLVDSGAGLHSVTQLSNGDVLTVKTTTSRVYRSTDNGVTWDGGVLVAGGAGLVDITQLSNGDVLTVGLDTSRVYRSTDNGVTWDGGVLISGAGLVDITQLSNGDVLAVGAATNRVYRSSGTGYVTTLYDQSGNGRNATQTIAGSQPSIMKFGVLNEDVNSNVFLDFDTKFMTGAVGLGTAQSIVAVYSKSVNGVNTHIFGSGKSGGDTGINIFEDTNNKTNVTRDASMFSDPVDSSLTKKIIVGENTNNPPQYYKNGVQNIVTSALPTSVEANLISIGTSGFPMQARFYGGMIFTNTLSTSDRQTLERNQGNFYGITVA